MLKKLSVSTCGAALVAWSMPSKATAQVPAACERSSIVDAVVAAGCLSMDFSSSVCVAGALASRGSVTEWSGAAVDF
jgi:hypothetical protein